MCLSLLTVTRVGQTFRPTHHSEIRVAMLKAFPWDVGSYLVFISADSVLVNMALCNHFVEELGNLGTATSVKAQVP